MYNFAKNNSITDFTNLLSYSEDQLQMENYEKLENDGIVKLANKCFLGKHEHFHTVVYKMNTTNLGLNINQCKNLCEKKTDSLVDHISLNSIRSWDKTKKMNAELNSELLVKDLHSVHFAWNRFRPTICNWSNNPSIKYKSVIIDQEYLAVKGCW